jgi:hypothetical protein
MLQDLRLFLVPSMSSGDVGVARANTINGTASAVRFGEHIS